jgi:hypothetical protein
MAQKEKCAPLRTLDAHEGRSFSRVFALKPRQYLDRFKKAGRERDGEREIPAERLGVRACSLPKDSKEKESKIREQERRA